MTICKVRFLQLKLNDSEDQFYSVTVFFKPVECRFYYLNDIKIFLDFNDFVSSEFTVLKFNCYPEAVKKLMSYQRGDDLFFVLDEEKSNVIDVHDLSYEPILKELYPN